MARAKTYTSTGSYKRYDRVLPGSDAFRGADFKDEAGLVDQTRLAFCRNMWKDYDASDVGGIETFPGYRLWHNFDDTGEAHGLWQATIRDQNVFVAHIGTKLYIVNQNGVEKLEQSGFADRKSSAFMFNNKFYLLDGSKYWVVDYASSTFTAKEIAPGNNNVNGYHPITYIDNIEYEQRNMLDDHFIEKWNIPTAEASCQVGNLGLSVHSTSGSTITFGGNTSDGSHGAIGTKRTVYVPDVVNYNGNTYDTVDINANAFNDNDFIETIVLAKVNDIKSNAFANCSKLKTVIIRELTGTISSSAFINCPSLKYIWIDKSNEMNTTLDMGSSHSPFIYLFYDGNSHLTNVTDGRNFPGDVVIIKAGQTATFGNPSGVTYTETRTYEGADSFSISLESDRVVVETSEPTVGFFRVQNVNDYRDICVVALSSGGDLVNYDSIFSKMMSSSYSSSTGTIVFAADGRCDFYISTPCISSSEVRLIGGAFGANGQSLHTTNKTNGVIYRFVDEGSYHSQIQLYCEDLSVLNDTVLQLKGTAEASRFSASGYADYKSATGYTGTSLAAIQGCRLSCVFDGRPFYTGNPNLPNTVFYASRRSDTGVIDPTYIGVCNFFNDGTGNAQNVAIMGGSDTLFVFKNKSLVNGSVFYHTPRETGMNFLPKDYPSVEGAKDHDCVGACCNFRDDYVFLTKRGVDGVDKAQLNLERTIGHRSSMVDQLLIGKELKNAQMIEWKEWLLLSCDGEVLMADSRQMFQNLDSVEYEWFRLTDIGGHINDRDVYRYASGGYLENYPAIPIEDWVITYASTFIDLIGQNLKVKRVEDYADETFDFEQIRVECDGNTEYVYVDSEGYLVVKTDEKAGGTLLPARFFCTSHLKNDEDLYFLTDRGRMYKSNVDMRGYALCEEAISFPEKDDGTTETLYWYNSSTNGYVELNISDQNREWWTNDKRMAYKQVTPGKYVEYGYVYCYGIESSVYLCEEPFYPIEDRDIDPHWYTYDNHRYCCEIATKYDDCGSPHLSKNTIKNSVAITCKTFSRSAFDVLARSERKEWKKIETVDSSFADFTNVDFSAYSFRSRREYIYRSDEYLKKWVRKQYDFKNECFRHPFGIYSIAYGYYIHGKVQF